MVEQTDEEFIAAVKRAAWKEHFYHTSATVLRLSAITERLEKERDNYADAEYIAATSLAALTADLLAMRECAEKAERERDAALAKVERLTEGMTNRHFFRNKGAMAFVSTPLNFSHARTPSSDARTTIEPL